MAGLGQDGTADEAVPRVIVSVGLLQLRGHRWSAHATQRLPLQHTDINVCKARHKIVA